MLTPASARSNSIDSFGSNNSVMCRYCSISRFEVGSGGNGGPSERREGYPQPLLRPANSQLTEELLCPRVLGPLRGPRSCAGRECGLADPEKPPLGDRGACVGPRRGARQRRRPHTLRSRLTILRRWCFTFRRPLGAAIRRTQCAPGCYPRSPCPRSCG